MFMDFCDGAWILKKAWAFNFTSKISGWQLFALGFKLRGDAVRVLTKSENAQTRFIFRDDFWASNIKDKKLAR